MGMTGDWWDEANKSAHAKATEQVRRVCRVLRLLGVETATMEFDGSGDSGTVDDPEYEPGPPAGVPRAIDNVLVNAGYQLLPGGWEINAGSYGRILIDVPKGTVDLEFNHKYDEEYYDVDAMVEDEQLNEGPNRDDPQPT